MSAYDYDADLEARSYRRLYREELEIAFSALDCVLNGEKAVYASSELTTGRRAYELLREHGLGSLGELDQTRRAHLLSANMEEAVVFARRLRERLGGGALVISPAPYVAPGWTQAEYLHFWETLIRTRIGAVYFNDGWEYSNGCTFEFAVATEHGIGTYDAGLAAIEPGAGVQRIGRAAADLERRHLDGRRLRLNLDRLRQAV